MPLRAVPVARKVVVLLLLGDSIVGADARGILSSAKMSARCVACGET